MTPFLTFETPPTGTSFDWRIIRLYSSIILQKIEVGYVPNALSRMPTAG